MEVPLYMMISQVQGKDEVNHLWPFQQNYFNHGNLIMKAKLTAVKHRPSFL